jgi:hypothetical protein
VTWLTDLSPQTLESLSAYLDAEVSEKERRDIERRLVDDVTLRLALEDLRQLRLALRTWPQPRLPRSFMLTPEMVGQRPRGAGYPALRLATALAMLGFVITMGLDAFGSRLMALPMARSAAAPAMEMAAVSEVSEDEALQKEPAPEAPAPAEPELPADSLAQSEAAPVLGAAAVTPTVAGTAAPEGRTSEKLEATAVAGLTAPNELQPVGELDAAETGIVAGKEAPAFWARLSRPPFQPTLRSVEAILGTVVLVLAWLTLRARRRS